MHSYLRKEKKQTATKLVSMTWHESISRVGCASKQPVQNVYQS